MPTLFPDRSSKLKLGESGREHGEPESSQAGERVGKPVRSLVRDRTHAESMYTRGYTHRKPLPAAASGPPISV